MSAKKKRAAGEDAPAATPAAGAVAVLTASPYVGPRPFTSGEAFFGREKETTDLANRLEARRVVLLHSPSGAGKTSLVQAGLKPLLQGRGFLVSAALRVSLRNPDLLSQALPTGFNHYMFSTLLSLVTGELQTIAKEVRRDPKLLQQPPNLVFQRASDFFQAAFLKGAKANGPGVLTNMTFTLVLKLLGDFSSQGETERKASPGILGRVKDTLAWFGDTKEGQPLAKFLEKYYDVFRTPGTAGGDLPEAVSGATVPDEATEREAPPSPKLILFDQFEEILSLNPADRQAKEDYFAWLMPALYDTRFHFLFSMREDHIAGLEPFLQYFPDRLSARYRLEFLGEEAAMRAIRQPAERSGVDFHEEAARKLVKDLRLVRLQQAGGVSEELGPFVEPVQLQVVCSNLWQAPRPNAKRITHEDVEHWGGVENALVHYYDSRLGEVARLSGVDEDVLRRWVESALISEGGLRNQVLAGQEEKVGLNPKALRGLVDAYLVRKEERGGRTWYELAHDRLVEPIRKANSEWSKENVSPFRPQAEHWAEQGYPSSLLLLGTSLEEALEWVAARPERTTTEEQSYLQQSVKQQETNLRAVRAELGIDLERRGWGVIFAATPDGEDPPERKALLPLMQRRQAQAGELYREFKYGDGYRPGESARKFLGRHGVGYSPADPAKMPYYLLVVGDPQTIPYEFQYGLDVQFAVGRLDFPTLEGYHNYARSVVSCETQHEAGEFALPEKISFFAPANPEDAATHMSLEQMMQPLAGKIGEQRPGAQVETIFAEQATRARLRQLLGEAEAPAVLFFAGRVPQSPSGHPLQLRYTGSLLCQDWPGPKEWSSMQLELKGASLQKLLEYSYSVNDVSDQACLLGMVAILFGGPSAGFPQFDNFPGAKQKAEEVAPYPFTSRLAQRLLGLPAGGVQAIIGHVDKGWAASFRDLATKEGDLVVFENLLKKLLAGQTVGLAMENFSQRYTLLSSALTEMQLAETLSQRAPNEADARWLQLYAVDARNYILLGDPATRLPLSGSEAVKPSSRVRPSLPQAEIPEEWKQPLRVPPPPQEEEKKDEPKDASF